MEKGTNGQAVAALVLGIASIVLAFLIPLGGVICGIIGIVLGVRTKDFDAMGKGGFVCSIIGTALSVVIWILSAIVVAGLISYLM